MGSCPGQRLKMRAKRFLKHGLFEDGCRNVFAPPLSAGQRILQSLVKIVWPIREENSDQKFGLETILDGFQAIGARTAAISDNQLVDCEPLGSRDLNHNAGAVGSCGQNGLGQ